MDLVQRLWENAYFPFFEGVLKRRQTHSLYKLALQTQWLPRETLEEQQLGSLNKLLAHAKLRVPYYRDNALFPSTITSLSELEDLPILGKAEIRVHGEGMLAENAGKAWWKSTGGSTGEPLRFAHDQLSHEWRTAMSLRGYAWAGAVPGSKQAYIWGVSTAVPGAVQKQKELLHRKIERKRQYNCFSFTPEAMQACYEDLQRWKPDVIVGYTNPTYEFARFIEESGQEPLKVRSVLCAAEKVHPTQRETIARVFRADVFDTYGSREFMLIASECDSHEGMHVSMENLVVEIVDAEGKAVAPGETGRLVITDLHNYSMPFIRYEIGDLARASDHRCACGRESQVLEDIVGRSLDVVRTPEGRVIPGELFPHLMKDYPEVLRFQVVQEEDYSISLALKPNGTIPDHVAASIRDKLAMLIEADVAIDIKTVADIPLTPSGKHRVTISKVGA
ncbi:MAG: phenylacetate--CoA ligase family protein [Congregibacter sp.]